MASRDYEAVVRSSDAVVLWDKQNCLPLQKLLSRDDIIVFLTPVVVPYNSERSNTDPFEPLGRAIAARHPKVHHVPYTLRDGITSTHVAHIKKARVIVFVISGPPDNGEPNQAKDAEIARIIGEHLPQIVIACFSVDPNQLRESVFPTLIQIPGYSPSALENAAALLFGEGREGLHLRIGRSPPPAPESWPVEPWSPNDIEPVQRLWHQSLPPKFHLADLHLKLLLSNPGYSSNYIVREPNNRTIVGFCATYTSFVDEEGYKLIGSLVMLLVDESFQGRGVGRTLHAHALAQLRRTRGVQRLQLGSTFPRLLYGIPSESPSLGWFRRRGWSLDENLPGRGRTVCDWVLSFEDWPRQDFAPAGLEFRPCKFDEYGRVIKLVEREAGQKDEMGWYEQYRNLTDTFNVPDVILGLEGDNIVATALTYCPDTENQASRDLPWARNVSDDVGGITCICIIDDNRRDLIFIRLLHACIQSLAERGMRGLFLDGMKGKDEGFQSLGFQKWASYQESWRSV